MLSDSDTCTALRMQCGEHLYDNLRDPSLPLRVTIWSVYEGSIYIVIVYCFAGGLHKRD